MSTPHTNEKVQIATIAEALRDQMTVGTSGRWVVDFGTTPEHLAEDVWAALFPPGVTRTLDANPASDHEGGH